MLKAGAIVLSLWSGLNLLLAGAILVSMTMFGANAPGLRILFDEAAVRGLDPRALATINALAILFNACALAFCLLMLYVTWSRVAVGVKSAFWALAIASGSLQVFGFKSDAYLGGRNLLANVASSAVLLVGLGLSGLGTYRGRAGPTRARAQEV
jgi:hypothetical protein